MNQMRLSPDHPSGGSVYGKDLRNVLDVERVDDHRGE